MNMIRMQVSGRLGKDPELRTTPSNMAVANFSLGSTTKYKDQENTTWIRCVLWGRSGEALAQYAKQGDQIFAWGTMEEKSYEKDGEQKKYMEMRCEGFEFGAKSKKNENAPKANNQSTSSFDPDDLEIPF